jgi:hypothetical protein
MDSSKQRLLELELQAKLQLFHAEAERERAEREKYRAERAEKDRLHDEMLEKLNKLMAGREEHDAHEHARSSHGDADLQRGVASHRDDGMGQVTAEERDKLKAEKAAMDREIEALRAEIERAKKEATQERLLRARAMAEKAAKEHNEAELMAKLDSLQKDAEKGRLELARMQARDALGTCSKRTPTSLHA